MAIQVRPYDIGCEPSPSIPAETLLADGRETYLLFFAVSKAVGESGYLDDLGVAVLACRGCSMSKFGYPNDEGMPEHPLYDAGIASATSSVLEVINSPWVREVSGQMIASARRIWGDHRGLSSDWKCAPPRHFIITLKEQTFECLASSLVVEQFCKTFEEAYAHVIAEFNKH